MLSLAEARQFADAWVDAWNAHDLDAVMEHYADEVMFWSPMIVKLLDRPTGKLEGKAELRSYFATGLAANSDLHFTLLEIFVGVDSITILFRRHDGIEVTEMMVLDEASHRVTMGRAHYGPRPMHKK